MTFVATPRTLLNVVYGQFRTLISLLIVVVLAVAFLWGGFHLLDTITGTAAPPPPTPTTKPYVEQPGGGPTAVPTRRPISKPHPSATPRPVATSTPRPTPTPAGPPKLIMTAYANTANPTTTFHVSQGLPQLYCWVRNAALPTGAVPITFSWWQEQPNQFLYQYSTTKSVGLEYTGVYWPYVAQKAGKYRCDATVNGQLIGSVHFTTLP